METEMVMGGKAVLKLFTQRERDISPIVDGLLGRHISKKYPSTTIQPILDRAGRSDHLLQKLSGGSIPSELTDMGFGGTFLKDQFSTPLADPSIDVVVLSAASDLEATNWVHRSHGWAVSPPTDWTEVWSDNLRGRFEQEFEETDLLTADEYTSAIRDVIARIREVTGAHVILLGTSTLGGELVSTYFDREDDHRLRSHRFNAAQIRLSMALGVSVVDVDRIIANVGGATTVTAPLEYSAEAQDAIAADLVYVLHDIGFFEERPLVAQVGQEWGAA